jgi:hypothetical protein
MAVPSLGTMMTCSNVLSSIQSVATCSAKQIEMGKSTITEGGAYRRSVRCEQRHGVVVGLRRAIPSNTPPPLPADLTRAIGALWRWPPIPSKASSGGARMGWRWWLVLSRFPPSKFYPRRGRLSCDGERGFGDLRYSTLKSSQAGPSTHHDPRVQR